MTFVLAFGDEAPGAALLRVLESAPDELYVVRFDQGSALWYRRWVDAALLDRLAGDAATVRDALDLHEYDSTTAPALRSAGARWGLEALSVEGDSPEDGAAVAATIDADPRVVVARQEVEVRVTLKSGLVGAGVLLDLGARRGPVVLRASVDTRDFARPPTATWEQTFTVSPDGTVSPSTWAFKAIAYGDPPVYQLRVIFREGTRAVGTLMLGVGRGFATSVDGALSPGGAGPDAALLEVLREGVDVRVRAQLGGQVRAEAVLPQRPEDDWYFRELDRGAAPFDVGYGLLDELLPFRAFVRDVASASEPVLRIESEAPLAPFELLPLDREDANSPLLGEVASVARWAPSAGSPDATPLPAPAAACVRPTYADAPLPSAIGEQDDLKRRYGVLANVATRQELDALLARSDVDLVHFAGHASGPPVALRLEDASINPGAFRAFQALFKARRPLFFLNACQAGAGALLAPGARGDLVKSLLRSNARGVVATMIRVDSAAARRAATAFYDAFDAGQTVAGAVRAIRRLARTDAANATTYASYLAFGAHGLRRA